VWEKCTGGATRNVGNIGCNGNESGPWGRHADVEPLGKHQREDAEECTEAVIDRDKTQAHNIVGAAVTLGLSVIMLILMAIVAGYFVQEAPSNGAFSAAIDQVESVGGTAFILLAVALLAVPVVAIVGYFMRSGLGAFISMGGRR